MVPQVPPYKSSSWEIELIILENNILVFPEPRRLGAWYEFEVPSLELRRGFIHVFLTISRQLFRNHHTVPAVALSSPLCMFEWVKRNLCILFHIQVKRKFSLHRYIYMLYVVLFNIICNGINILKSQKRVFMVFQDPLEASRTYGIVATFLIIVFFEKK